LKKNTDVPAKVAAFINQKGGIGKTSMTHNIGCILALHFGYKVLFVDGDGQANLTTAFGLNPDEYIHSVARLMTDSKGAAAKYVIETRFENCFLIPSNKETFNIDTKIAGESGREFLLGDQLDALKDDYDLILIDTPPQMSQITINTLTAVNGVFLVYDATEFSLDALSQITAAIFKIQGNKRLSYNNLEIVGAIENNYNQSTKKINRWVDSELAKVDKKVIPQYLPRISTAVEIKVAAVHHKPMIVHAPKHQATLQYIQAAQEVSKWLDR